jgi:hypothetical protein
VILVNVWEGTNAFEEAQGFCDLWGIDGTVLVDESGELVDALQIRGVPTNILVDGDGTIVCVGASSPRELEAAVNRLFGESNAVGPLTGESEAWHWQQDPEHIEAQLAMRRTAQQSECEGG